MISVQNIIDKNKSLMTIIFNKKVMDHMLCKCDDHIVVLQSNFNARIFLLVKADSGYRIKRYPSERKTYQINIGFGFSNIPEFDFTECTYYLRKHNMIRLFLKI